MSRTPVPIAQLGRRMPTAGRLRAGKKAKSGAPQKLDTWRATSHDREAVEQIAAIYGGTVTEWSDPKVAAGQYEVVTDAREVRIVLPPDPLGDTPIYELWSGGGCQRRCDGVTCATTVQGPDGGEPGEVDCICAHKGALACVVKTRLSVVLPDVKFAGIWRIDTNSEHAARELPGMVEMIATLIGAGQLPYAHLALEQRQKPGKRFAVPVLRLPTTLEGLVAGRGQAGALAPGNGPPANGGEIEAGSAAGGEPLEVSPSAAGARDGSNPSPVAPPAADDDVVDAEVVEDDGGVPDYEVLRKEAFLSKAQLLKLARPVATSVNVAPPGSYEAIAGIGSAEFHGQLVKAIDEATEDRRDGDR